MKYISLAFHNSEMIVVNGMDVFTAHFCYSKKQRQGAIEILAPAAIISDDTKKPVSSLDLFELEAPDEDDI